MDLPELIITQLCQLAEQYNLDKLVLFGSRARETNLPKSDIDLAAYGCADFINFYMDCNENTDTLLKYDIVDMDSCTTDSKLRDEIKRDGVVLYAKAK